MKNKKVRAILIKALLAFLSVFALMVVVGLIVPVGNDAVLENTIKPEDLNLLNFKEYLDSSDSSKGIEIKAEDYAQSAAPYSAEDGEPKSSYSKKAFKWEEDADAISFSVNINKETDYVIAIDYLSLQTTVSDISLNVKVNGNGSDLLSNIELVSSWTDSTSEPVYDIYRNQVSAVQETCNIWRTSYLYDQRYYSAYPVSFELEIGKNTITLEKNAGALYIGSVYLIELEKLTNLGSYTPSDEDTTSAANELITIEAEQPVFKSTAEIRTVSVQNTNVTPYSTEKNMLNVLSGDSFNKSGYAITYAFKVETAGYYNISMKYYISQTNTSVYSKVLVDNEILYDELNCYEFKDRTGYNNETLNNGKDNILFYFEPGVHTLTLQLDASLQSQIYFEMSSIIEEINDLYLDIVKLTGGNTDKNKQWNVAQYIPDIEHRLSSWISRLEKLLKLTDKLSKSNPEKQNRLYQNISNAYGKLVDLAKKPNEIPHKLTILTEGSSSISNMLSNSLHTTTYSPLFLDKIYVHGVDAKLPKAGTNFFMDFFGTVQRVFKSGVDETDEDVVEIWVNRSTYYVSLMQQYADAYYKGKKVRLSLLPDESKLTYANASGTNPDAALGVSQSVPYDLGLRGALVDLRTMPGFEDVIKDYVPGAYTGMMACDSVYGLPETQDFNVIYYRTDIINDVLGISVPETYEDLIGILPAMQRMGMNFTMPLAGGSGLKGISVTAPFIYQYGGDIYAEDYLSTAIDTPEAIAAINMMVELFSLYSLPLTAQSFYDSFRNTTLPMGQAGFDTYLQLLTAAPEITGKWDIALPLGTRQADGSIDRTNCVTVKAVCIFEQSDNQKEAWEFIKWWLSEETQTRFANGIVATYGETFMWNTANVNAFKSLPINKKHIETIIASWEDLYNIPQTPATYIVERGISDAWNAAVFDGVSVRAAISDAVIDINKEIDRKMSEFGFIDNKGVVIKPYFVPTVDEIKKWMED